MQAYDGNVRINYDHKKDLKDMQNVTLPQEAFVQL